MLTHYSANLFLAQLCGKSTSAVTTTVFVGLSTTEPTQIPGGTNNWNVTEPDAADGYARVLLGIYGQSGTQKMGTADLGEVENSDIIFFPEVTDGNGTGAWGTCSYFCLWTAATGGNLLAFGELTAPISPVEGEVPIIRVGDLTLSIDKPAA